MITVFGSINVDFVTRVHRIAAPGETVVGETYACLPGGKGANQALAARRAGAAVRLLGAVGHDAFADTALAMLRNEGVDLSGVRRSGLPTGAAFISVDPEGRNAISVAAGANAAVQGATVRGLAFATGDVLLLQREIPDAEGETAASVAKTAGASVVVNLAPSGRVSDGYLSLIDILVMNEHEASDLSAALAVDLDRPPRFDRLATALRSRFGTDAVVTLGREGAVGWRDGDEHRGEALPVEVLDTTGAGDAFTGAFVAALSDGVPFGDALRFGTVAGSLTCTRRGAQAGIPTREEIETALANRRHRS